MSFEIKQEYGFYDLVKIMEILRGKNGCPWDVEQTHESIRQNFIEETYEAIEAIDTNDAELLKEELGDVMLQVVFHAQIEKEQNSFSIDDVCNEICKKLIVRHPHVFSDVIAETPEEVLKNWDRIKMETKSQKSTSEAMNSISKWLPALIYIQKLQKKAEKSGYGFSNSNEMLDEISVKIKQLKETEGKELENKIGDILFELTNVSRLMNIDSEKALFKAGERFIKEFE